MNLVGCPFIAFTSSEKTRTQLNSFKDTEDSLREQCHDLSSRLKAEQRQAHDNKTLLSSYGHLLYLAKDKLENVLNNINKQFEKEKAKREAEKAAADAEKAKKESENSKAENEEVGLLYFIFTSFRATKRRRTQRKTKKRSGKLLMLFDQLFFNRWCI